MAGLALALGPRAEANTTYTYTGKPFTTFVNSTSGPNPYTTSDFIQVTFTTVNQLLPNLPFPTLVTPVSLQMTDGGNGPSVDPMGTVGCSTSSTVCTGIVVATDATGAITQWVMESVTLSPANGLQTVFGTFFEIVNGQAVGVDLAGRCPTTNAGCATTDAAQLVAGFNTNTTPTTAGVWSSATTQGLQPTVTVALKSPSPAVFGQPMTFSVTVLNDAGQPVPGSVKLFARGQPCGGVTPCGSITLDTTGAATIRAPDAVNGIPDPTTFTSVGQNQIGAVYIPPIDSGYQPNFVTIPVPVVPTIAVSPSPAVYGQAVTFSTVVDAPPFISGITSADFYFDDSTAASKVPVVNGQAQFAPKLPIAVGSHYIQSAAFSLQTNGTYTFEGYSNTLYFMVNKANTATGLTSTQNGSNATFTATVAAVAPGAGTPTGTVTFFNGSAALGTAPVSGGAAMLSAANVSGTITAAYSGDRNFNGSASAGVTVNPPSPPPAPVTHLSISSSLNPSMLGQAVTFSASVTASGGTGTPGGSVQFLDGSTPIGSAALSGGGASVTTSSLTVGSHAIAAQYSGDSAFPGASASLGQVVNRLASTLTLNSSAAQVNAGQSVMLIAQVGPAPSGGIPAPTGQVTFSSGGTSLGAVAVTGGSASVTTGNLSAGTVQFTAAYGGDSNYSASNASVTVTVLAGPLTITTTSLVSGTVNVPYSASVAAMGGTQPYTFTIGGLPSGLKGDTTGAISGTPTDGGSFNVSVQVTDSKGATANATLTLKIAIPPLTISATLPDGKQGTSYSGSVSVTGGVGPYKLSITGLPPGLTATVSGASATVSGKPTTAGSFNVSVQATDSKGTTASKSVTVNITSTALGITPATPIGGTAGQPYALCINVAGGTPPYMFAFSGTPPPGLSIDPMTGCISGTPSVGGQVTIAVTVTDSTGAKTTVTYTETFALPAVPPALNFTGLGNSADPRTQPGFGVELAGPYPADIQGTLTLTFHPASGVDTGEVMFATGGRTIAFTIPANSTAGVFTISAALQTGTVAGSISIIATMKTNGADITPSPAPAKQVQVNAGPPVIVSAQAARASTGFTVSITGYTSTREMTQAVFAFNPAAGASLQTTSLTLSVGSLFAPWLQGTQVIGSQFLFTQPFTVTGNLQAVTSITVTLTNSQGSSQAVTATIQ
jgi:hypothetical protein